MRTPVVLLVPGNKGISFDELVSARSEVSKLSSDSQELLTVLATSLDQKQPRPVPAEPGFKRFECSPARKAVRTESGEEPNRTAGSRKQEHQDAIPIGVKKRRNVP